MTTDATRLCTACGMCCDGTIFGFVPTDEEDRQRLPAEIFTFETNGEKLGFFQPCAALQGTLCSVYAERPATCRKFSCRVLTRMTAGELDFDSAKGLIEQARSAANKVIETLKPGEDLRAARGSWRDLKGDWRENAKFRLLMFALERFLDLEFRTEHQRVLTLENSRVVKDAGGANP